MIPAAPHATLRIQLWIPTTAAPSVDRTDPYVDEFWVPAIGPMAVAAARSLQRLALAAGGAGTVRRAQLEEALGLPATGTHAPLLLDQLEAAGLAHRTGSGVAMVRSSFPVLTPAQVAALPPLLQQAHGRWVSALAEPVVEAEAPAVVAGEPSARIRAMAEAVEAILTRADLGPLQRAYRWHSVVRLAEEARDEALLDWAAPDLEATLAEAQDAAQAASEAMWGAQLGVAIQGTLPETHRGRVSAAAAGLVDWLVAEFPTVGESPEVLGPLDRLDRSDG